MAKDVRRALMIARKPRQTGGSYSLNDVRAGGIGPSQLVEEKPTFMGMRPEQLSKIAAGAPGYEHLQQAAHDWLADNPQNPPSATVGDILQRQDMGYAYADGGDVAPRAYRDDSGQFTYEGQPVKPEAPYEGPDAFGQRWRVDDMLVPAGETAPDQMTPRMTYRGPQPTDYRNGRELLGGGRDGDIPFRSHWGLAQGGAVENKDVRRALMIARDQRALLRRVANIYPGPGGGMDPSPGGGGYSGPGGGKYIGPSRYADGGGVDNPKGEWSSVDLAPTPYSKGVPHAVVKNPTPDDIHRIMDMTGDASVRWLRDKRTKDVHAFTGKVLHDRMRNALDIPAEQGGIIYRDKGKLTPGTSDDLRDVLRYAEGGSVPPFKLHSGAAKVIKSKGQAKATPQQYAAMPGIKPDELKHSKFDTLGSKALPREEVIKHLEDNRLPIEETQLGGEGRNTATKFHGPETTLPGGKNYREVLLRLNQTPDATAVRQRAEDLAKRDGSDMSSLAENWQRNYMNLARAQITPADHKSMHWQEPNVLAHVRMSDRKGPNGEKVLHVEEVQSDWGQQGREKGFGKREGKVEQQPGGFWRITWPDGTFSGGYDTQTSAETALEYRGKGVPHGPYVDNTQKWTDLALKRVLHEAAHGGYDKIVVTPGDEQNKRYSLENHVKNIQYYPDTKYLGATTHDDRGVEHEGVEPDDLAKHIGKEAADRILKQPLQRFEGRGRLGGEFYHELEGEGLKVGGEGMRGYYDNILPKRLQALAQPHDPQAKVNLHDSFQDAPTTVPNTIITRQRAPMTLHSLDVTPQMRDSIKANGFNSFKRGGEVDDDPIKDWQWRPTEDVRNELQLDEIPSHVHKFGEFMDETARRAATQGLTPRDLIKAYAITRSSIGRGALPVSTVRRPKNPEYGFDALPKGLQGSLRPEGAMGHWLHTKMGQRYLDEAEAGRVDEEAVRDAIKSMGAFGLPDTAEGKALRWAPKNLPGQEGRVSELIARAHRGQSSPEEWRGEMRVPGIAESKAGFFASMLGRGDQPTLDARQIILNTGQSTKKAAPYLSPKGAKEAAVNRLTGRQTELGLKHDKSMSPFYQHLAHHTIWDKVGNEQTTHDDLMQALRGAKDGGRQGYAKGGGDKPLSLIEGHPVVQGLSMALPPEAELQQLLRKAGIVRPYNQPSQANVERALEIAKTYAMPLGVGSKDDPSAYYGVKQPTAARDVTTKAGATAGFSLKPEKAMSWKEFGAIGKGGHVVNLSGDRTRFGTLHEINGQPLNWPVKVYAGPDYIREPVKGRAWASAPGVISGLNRTVTDLSKKGPVFGMYSPYGATGGDFAHHMFDAVMAQVNPDQISKSAKKKFDAAMRDASFIMGQTDKDKSKRERVKPRMEDWPGVDDPKAASEFARKNLTGDHRKAILEYLDKKSWTDEGFPHVGMTRVAVTDPKLLKVPQNVIGGNVALLTPSDTPLSSKHPSYSAGQPGEYVGTLPFAPRHYALPVTTGHFVKTPSAGKGVYVDPYSLNDRARGGYRTLFERNYVPEPVSNQMAEGAEEGIRKMPLYGLKRGGSVSRALDIARKINGR